MGGSLFAQAAMTAHLRIELPQGQIIPCSRIFSKGVRLPIAAGGTLKDVLCRQIGIDPDYLALRIQTIFLNGQPVDDENTALVADGDTIALSAAMPGLVGTTLRKGGHLAAMRMRLNQNGQPRRPREAAPAEARITVKLFNLVCKELGPMLLAGGVEVEKAEAIELVAQLAPVLAASPTSIQLDGRPISAAELTQGQRPMPDAFLRLQVLA